MSPEHLIGNMWRIKENESVTGRTTTGEYTLNGPVIVRIHEFTDHGLIRIQGPSTAPVIELDGLDFAAHVKVKKIK